MLSKDFLDRALAVLFVSVIWLVVCGILPVFVFGGVGHGSIFLAMPIWWEGVVGAVLHSIAVMLLPHKLLDSRPIGVLIGLAAALVTAAIVILNGGLDVLVAVYGLVLWIMVLLGVGIPIAILWFTRRRSANAAS